MSKVIPGQVWKNGRVVVSVQNEAEKLNLVLFRIDGNQLRFKKTEVCGSDEEALARMESLGCVLTDTELAAVEESLSVL